MKTITILGSTGSIGTQCLDVISLHRDKFRLNYLTTNNNIDVLEKQCALFEPNGVAIADESAYQEFKRKTAFKGVIVAGKEGIEEAAADQHSDLVVVAMVGMSGLTPTIAAIKSRKDIALANKETLVVAGQYITDIAHQNNINIFPIDSEHSAIWQCLRGENIESIRSIILTASGGPFLKYTEEQLQTIT